MQKITKPMFLVRQNDTNYTYYVSLMSPLGDVFKVYNGSYTSPKEAIKSMKLDPKIVVVEHLDNPEYLIKTTIIPKLEKEISETKKALKITRYVLVVVILLLAFFEGVLFFLS